VVVGDLSPAVRMALHSGPGGIYHIKHRCPHCVVIWWTSNVTVYGESMFNLSRAVRNPCAVAVFAVAGAWALAVPLGRLNQIPSSLFLAAVMVSSWYGGLGPGLLATALSALALDCLLMAAHRPSAVTELASSVRLGLFVSVAALISWLNDIWKRRETNQRQRDQCQEESMAVLAHELRNPLAPIMYSAHALRLDRTNEKIASEAEQLLERQVRQLVRLIEDLQDVFRARAGKMQLRKEPLILNTAIEQAVAAVLPVIKEHGHQLELGLPAEPVRLEADPTRLEQILVNLLNNAARYTAPGGTIWLSAERRAESIVLRVRDTGIGLDAEELPHIFELFVQAKSSSRGGMGVGLTLVRSLVEMHGGSVSVRSKGKGHGSEFEVQFPALSL
jgi:signal transduction histidine kinase